MNRKYTCDEYKTGVELIREYFDKPNISTDVIVGFPGETDEEFKATYEYLEKLKLAKMHIFKYSRRKGTAADRMENQIDDSLKEIRSNKLLELERKLAIEFNESFKGSKKEVLFEEKVKTDDGEFYSGLTEEYVKVYIKSKDELHNCIKTVEIIGKYTDKYKNNGSNLGEIMLAIEV